MDVSVLQRIGLTRGEVKVYFALLELGLSTTGAIAKNSGVHSSKVYPILDRLAIKGLVSSVVKNNVKHFEAAHPSRLIDYLKERRQELVSEEAVIHRLIPQLELKQKEAKVPQRALVYEGMRGVETAFQDVLRTLRKGNEYYVFGARGGLPVERVERFFLRFYHERAEHGIKLRAVFNEDARSIIKDRAKVPLTKIRYLPHITPAAINIYDDKTIIAVWTRQPVAFVLESKEAAASFREYFKALWKTAKK
ncbi:hypothetical protein HY642_05055 [Candidatus Woesearchaeota archaeon]|nr:hypothetical protein [Candidatus Woesearchaeota archaeon]